MDRRGRKSVLDKSAWFGPWWSSATMRTKGTSKESDIFIIQYQLWWGVGYTWRVVQIWKNTALWHALDLNTHFLKHKMWSTLQTILTIIFAGIALLVYGALGYKICQLCYWINRHPETHQLPGSHSTGSLIRFAHPVPMSIVNEEEIELSNLPPTSRPPHQSTYSYSSSTIDLEMMGISVDHLTELPLARCSSAILDHIV